MEDFSEFTMYEMKFVSNVAGVGSFTCVPAKEMSIQQVLDYLKVHPNDQFMHNYLLFTLAEYDEDKLEGLIEQKKRRHSIPSGCLRSKHITRIL